MSQARWNCKSSNPCSFHFSTLSVIVISGMHTEEKIFTIGRSRAGKEEFLRFREGGAVTNRQSAIRNPRI